MEKLKKDSPATEIDDNKEHPPVRAGREAQLYRRLFYLMSALNVVLLACLLIVVAGLRSRSQMNNGVQPSESVQAEEAEAGAEGENGAETVTAVPSETPSSDNTSEQPSGKENEPSAESTPIPTPSGKEEATPTPAPTAAPTVSPAPTKPADQDGGDGEEPQMYPADRVSEESFDIRLSRNDILMMGAGTVLREEQIDWEGLEQYFIAVEISEKDDVYTRIHGKSYQENEAITLDELRYLKLLHYNYEGEIQIGELIVADSIAEDTLSVFRELFRQEYQIAKMHLIDDYWTGDGQSSDRASAEDNNTSAYCFRTRSSDGGLSVHAYGVAIDINPLENPEVRYSGGVLQVVPESSADYAEDRSHDDPHVITEEDAACRLFRGCGFSWGGSWSGAKDYKHFERQ